MANASITNYREVKRKAAVGERIKIVASGFAGSLPAYANGDEFLVTSLYGSAGVRINRKWRDGSGYDAWVADREYVVLEPIAPLIAAPTPLSADPLYAAFRQFVADNADELRKLLPEINPPGISVGGIVDAPVTVADSGAVVARTPIKLTRAKVIAKATADVAELMRIGRDIYSDIPKESPFHNRCYAVNFHVNRDKRTVTALVNHGVSLERVPDAKFTAKCSPADVFHAEIGKAIALRKALGLAVPTEYTDAPQPEKPRVGARVSDDMGTGVVTSFDGYRGIEVNGGPCGGGFWTYTDGYHGATTLDDTDVDYNAVSAKGVAA